MTKFMRTTIHTHMHRHAGSKLRLRLLDLNMLYVTEKNCLE